MRLASTTLKKINYSGVSFFIIFPDRNFDMVFCWIIQYRY